MKRLLLYYDITTAVHIDVLAVLVNSFVMSVVLIRLDDITS